MKKVVLKFCNIDRKTPVLKSFLIKLQDFKAATLFKWESNSEVFLWILRNFEEDPFWRTPANGFFCITNVTFTVFFWNPWLREFLPKEYISGLLGNFELLELIIMNFVQKWLLFFRFLATMKKQILESRKLFSKNLNNFVTLKDKRLETSMN